jgi:hypothetical protein
VTRAASRLTTFLAVVVAWVFFRAQTFGEVSLLLKGMLGFYGLTSPPSALATMNAELPFWTAGDFAVAVAILAILLTAVWTLPNSQEILAGFRPAKQPIEPRPLVCAPLLIRWGLIGKDGQVALTASSGVLVASALFGAMIFQAVGSTTLHPFIYFQF